MTLLKRIPAGCLSTIPAYRTDWAARWLSDMRLPATGSPGADHKWTQVALHHALSENGETDWVQDADPILTRRSFAWVSMEVRAPAALFDGPDLKLWFAGNTLPEDFLAEVRSTGRTAKFGIGYMAADRDRYDRVPKKRPSGK
jgi:hypothetical protein